MDRFLTSGPRGTHLRRRVIAALARVPTSPGRTGGPLPALKPPPFLCRVPTAQRCSTRISAVHPHQDKLITQRGREPPAVDCCHPYTPGLRGDISGAAAETTASVDTVHPSVAWGAGSPSVPWSHSGQTALRPTPTAQTQDHKLATSTFTETRLRG